LSKAFLRFQPPTIKRETPQAVHQYLERSERNDFVMAEVSRLQTNVAEFEKRSVEDQVEIQVLNRLKEVQERAYQEGHAVGQEDGRRHAMEQYSAELAEKLKALDDMMSALSSLKKDILQANENHFLQFSIHLAEKLAHQQLQMSSEGLLELIRRTVAMAQGDERIQLRVSPEEFEFVEMIKAKQGNSTGLDSLRNVVVESDSTITRGGCVVQTNYSEVDARIEERIRMMWELLGEQIVRVPEKFVA